MITVKAAATAGGAAPTPVTQTPVTQTPPTNNDNLFGELSDADFTAPALGQLQPQPQSVAVTGPRLAEHPDLNPADYSGFQRFMFSRGNFLGLPNWRLVEFVVLLLGTFGLGFGLAVAMIYNAANYHVQAQYFTSPLFAAIAGLVFWLVMFIVYTATFGDGNRDRLPGRGLIWLVIAIFRYRGPFTFYLWIVGYPMVAFFIISIIVGISSRIDSANKKARRKKNRTPSVQIEDKEREPDMIISGNKVIGGKNHQPSPAPFGFQR